MELSASNKNILDLLLPYANNILNRMTSNEIWDFIESAVKMKKEKVEDKLLKVIINDDQLTPIEYRYIVWQCSKSSEVRGKKINYRFCNKWFMRKTQAFTNGRNPKNIQMSCPECSNRPRKNRENILLFNNERQAIEMCKIKNEE